MAAQNSAVFHYLDIGRLGRGEVVKYVSYLSIPLPLHLLRSACHSDLATRGLTVQVFS